MNLLFVLLVLLLLILLLKITYDSRCHSTEKFSMNYDYGYEQEDEIEEFQTTMKSPQQNVTTPYYEETYEENYEENYEETYENDLYNTKDVSDTMITAFQEFKNKCLNNVNNSIIDKELCDEVGIDPYNVNKHDKIDEIKQFSKFMVINKNFSDEVIDKIFKNPNINKSFNDDVNTDNLQYDIHSSTDDDNNRLSFASLKEYEKTLKRPGIDTEEYKMYEGVDGINPLNNNTYSNPKKDNTILNADAIQIMKDYMNRLKCGTNTNTNTSDSMSADNSSLFIPKNNLKKCPHKDVYNSCKKKQHYADAVNERNEQNLTNMTYGVAACYDIPQIRPPSCIPQKKMNVSPIELYRSNQGTPLEQARDTAVGSILPKFQYREVYDSKCYN